MSLTTTTHLNLPGTARAALELYRTVLGGEVAVTTYREAGAPADAPFADLVLFGLLTGADGARLMAYDVPGATTDALPAGSTHREQGVTITDRPFFQSLQGGSLDEVTRAWDLLADGGQVVEPLAASAWSPGFGMVTDRFGVTWVVDVRPADAA